jgi:hypothetical protein
MADNKGAKAKPAHQDGLSAPVLRNTNVYAVAPCKPETFFLRTDGTQVLETPEGFAFT